MKHKAYIALVVAMLLWSVSGIAIKYALTVFTPLTLIVVRFTIAVILMFLIGKVCHLLQPLAKKDIPLFLLAGLLQPFLYYILETYAYDYLSTPTVAEALLSTSPLLSPILAGLFLHERLGWCTLTGIIISTIGMVLLVVNIGSFSIGNPWGILIALSAVTTATLYTIVLRKMPEHYNPISIIFYVQLVSIGAFYIVWLLMGGIQAIQHVHITPQAVGAVAYLVIGASIGAFILFCYAVRIVGVSQANALNNLRPLFTALIMLTCFGELLPIIKWFGILLIIGGLLLIDKR